MKKTISLSILILGLAGLHLRAQAPDQPSTPVSQAFSAQQLDQLLGPIALYPDPLMAQILPAATVPEQIVMADRYIAGGGDPNQIDQQPWESSVKALARYPNLLKWMDDNLKWTTELGQAFAGQQQDVMNSIQRLRASAQSLGNLQSTPQQQVVADGGAIEILPADPQVIYVPVYSPDLVYYQSCFGAPFISFGVGWPIGVWLNCDFDWGYDNLVVWNRYHPRPVNWWRERPDERAAMLAKQTTVWHPVNRRNVARGNSGDRGWNNPGWRSAIPPQNRPETRPVQPQNVPANHASRPPSTPDVSRPAPVPDQRAASSRPAPNGAFIGIQSPRATRTYSDRGRQSRQAVKGPAPASRSSAPGNGGGGSRDSDSRQRR